VPVGDPANHISCFIEIKGALTEKESEAAIQRVVDRHEALRTSFLPGKEKPLQLVRSSGTAQLLYRELSAAESQPEALEEVLKVIYRQPFDMMQGPLHRVEMLRRGPNDHILALSIHHSIADGWSLGVFVQDLCTAYIMGLTGLRKAIAKGLTGVGSSLPPVPQTYSDWAAAERATWNPTLLAERAGYWKTKLKDSRQIWPAEPGVQRATMPLERWASEVPEDLTKGIRELARRSGATLFSTLLAAFQVTLAKWTGQDDILVGTPVANRSKASCRQTMGYFAGVVPLRGQVEKSQTFSEHLKATHETSVDGFANAIPFAEIAAALGEPKASGLHSIFDVRFALQNHFSPDVVLPRISTKLRMRSTGTSRFDLACEITEIGAELEVVWLFRPTMFTPDSISEINDLLLLVLKRSCHSPGSKITELHL
jgi:hypothetical protein